MRAQLSRRLAVLEARWRTLGKGRAGSPSGLEQSAGALKPGEWDAVLICFVGERNSYRFTVDDAGTRVDRLPGRRALGRAVENFRWPADGGQILVTGRASLGQMLIPRLASPGDRPLRLLILPDELLAAVPFEALEVQGRYLIETAVVAYAIAGLPGPFAFARRPPAAVALFGVGAALSLFTGREAWAGGLRMVTIGGGAGLVTWLIGRLLGATIG